MPQFSERDLAWMKEQGIDPNEVQVVGDEKPGVSNVKAIGSTLKAHAGSIIGGGAGALGATAILGELLGAPETLGSSLLLIPPTMAAAFGGGAAGQKIQEKILGDETTARLQQEAEQAAKEHPITSAATDIAASALTSGGKFSPGTLIKAIGGNKQAIANVAMQAGIVPAVGAGMSLATGQPVSGKDLLEQAAGGALFGAPSRLGLWAGRHGVTRTGNEPIADIINQPETPVEPQQLSPFLDKSGEGHLIDDASIKDMFLKQNPKPTAPADAATNPDYYAKLTAWKKLAKLAPDEMRQRLHQQYLEGLSKIGETQEPLKLKEPIEVPSTEPTTIIDRAKDFQKAKEELAGQVTKEGQPFADLEGPNRSVEDLEGKTHQSIEKPVSQNILNITADKFLPSSISRSEERPIVNENGEPTAKVQDVSGGDQRTEAERIQDQMEETGAKYSENQVNQEDLNRFNELNKLRAEMLANKTHVTPEGQLHPEFLKMWQEAEKIKNKYGGMTPEGIKGQNLNVEQLDKLIKELQPKAETGSNFVYKWHENLTKAYPQKMKRVSVQDLYFSAQTPEGRQLLVSIMGDKANTFIEQAVAHQNLLDKLYKLKNLKANLAGNNILLNPEHNTEIPIKMGKPLYRTEATPIAISDHIIEGKATTGSVMQKFAESEGHPFQPLAKWLWEHMDSKSRKVPWGSSPLRNRSEYQPPHELGGDKVNMSQIQVYHAPTVMEEAIHSMTSAKLPKEWAGLRGADLLKAMNDYKGGVAIKDLIEAYQITAARLGVYDKLFTTTSSNKLSEYDSGKGHAGSPDTAVKLDVPYAMGDLHEFIAHAFKNKEFQDTLNSIKTQDGRTLWQRVVDAISHLLGIPVNQKSMLDRVLRSSAELIQQERPSNAIQKQSTSSILPHSQERIGEEGSQRKGMGQGNQGKEVARQDTTSNREAIGSEPITEQQRLLAEDAIKNPSTIDVTDPARKGIFRPLESTFDKVGRVSTMLRGAFYRWESRKSNYNGLKDTALVDLQQYPKDLVNKVMAAHREAYRNNAPIKLSGEAAQVSKILSDYYGKIADIRNELGITIDGRKAGKHQFYVPDVISAKAYDTFVNNSQSPEASYLKNRWIDYVVKESKGSITRDEAKKNITAYIEALGGNRNNYESVKFGAIRKAAGYGMPEGMRETDAVTALDKYGRRASSDLAMYQELESKPEIAAALKLKDPRTGEIPMNTFTDSPLNQAKEVRRAMQWVTGDITSSMSRDNPRLSTLVRVVNNAILGTATGIRNIAQVPVMMTPYIKGLGDISAVMKGVANFREEARNSLLSGARQPNIDKLEFSDFNEAPDRFMAVMQKTATALRKWQGAEKIENVTRDITFSIGKELARQNVVGAKSGNKKSLDFLKKFGLLVDKDITKLKGAELENALNQVAKNFVDRNQGTYGGRGLPAGIVDSQFAPFLALQKWSFEKSNVIYQDVIHPLLTGKDFMPAIQYVLGSVLTGAAIQELNKVLTNREPQDPTVKEALTKGDPTAYASELATLMQLSSFAGIVGDGMKFITDVGLHGKAPRNVVSFPTATAALEIGEKTKNMLEALRMGEDPWDVFKAYSMDVMTKQIQAARMIANYSTNAEDVKRSDKFRDLRVFNELEGGPSADFTQANPYLGLDSKQFKRTGDINEAASLVPSLLQKAIIKAGGDPYELRRELASLKANNYQILPNIATEPNKFFKYLQYLAATKGQQAANERLLEWMQQNALNKAKTSLVP